MRLLLLLLLFTWSLNGFSKTTNAFDLDGITQPYSKYFFEPQAFLPAANPEQANLFCNANGFKAANSTESKAITKETLLAYGAKYVRDNMFFTYSIIEDFNGKFLVKVAEHQLGELETSNIKVYTHISCSL